MSWRVVVISKRAKLDFKLNFLVVRNEDGEKRIFLGDISVLVIESTAVSLTSYLITELITRGIKLIFCDHKHNPYGEVISNYGSYISSGRIRSQIKWEENVKYHIWQVIIQQKIQNQSIILRRVGRPEKAAQLDELSAGVLLGDITNREGHAAKVYFNALFGKDFYRDADDIRNKILDYGYTILLSCFNREISTNGYLTQIGIWHNNAENPFNLGCDLMEPYRPLIDYFAWNANFVNFEQPERHKILDILNSKVIINQQSHYLSNAIGIYVRSIFSAIETNDVKKIINYEL